jgi:tetratricopeptide (TPR) repeat protein
MKYKFQIQINTSNWIFLNSIGKFLLILSFFVATSCSLVPNELKLAEQLLETKPDSALHILQKLPPNHYSSESSRALYGLLLFQALDKNRLPLKPDSLINFSIKYYSSKGDNPHLATCYFYKARLLKSAQQYDEATGLYIKALDCSANKKDYALLGKIYGDMGDICSVQKDYKEALKKIQLSVRYFKLANKSIDASYRILTIGRTYRLMQNYKSAHRYYLQALTQTKDSIFKGVALQEIGINYYSAKQYDSAQYYLRKSILYPFKGTNYAIRCYFLANLFFDIEKYDSAYYYALVALKYPADFFTQRECYRILVNVEFLRNDIKQMAKYMTQYQNYTDSTRKVETQTKATVLENLHNTTQETQGTKRNMIWIVSVLVSVLFLVSTVVLVLYWRSKHRKNQLEIYKQELTNKQTFVSQNLSNKMEEVRGLQKGLRKSASAEDREKLDRELYEKSLHLSDWNAFSLEMNHAFNNIVDRLLDKYPDITRKEITWCCLHLLDIPNADRILLLNATEQSLYKLKQRLAQKLNLKSTKELDRFIKELATSNLN